MENIFIEFLPPWVETNLQPAFYDKESGTVLQQTARMYARVNMLIRLFNKLAKNTKTEVERFEEVIETRVTNFENSVNETVEDYIRQFVELHDYVQDYFANLDVQEEINNKLDQMTEDGILQEIITTYIQSSVTWTFDTVAEMKQATNLVAGSFARTLGFYSVNDGGGATYLITDTGTANEMDVIAVGNLFANLQYKDTVYVKQLGAVGDGTADDTNSFNHAIANCKCIFINSGTYKINRFLPEENQTIIGVGDATLQLNGTVAPLCSLKSNLKLENLTIESLNSNLEWNRCDISSKSNISLENCKISGFRHDSALPNAWGILITASKNINITNCYFDNNSQSDVAIVEDNDNIRIVGCDGTALKINFEPNTLKPTDNVYIANCNIEEIDLQENDYVGTSGRNFIIEDCTINKFMYDGSTAQVINCLINEYGWKPTSNIVYAGNLQLNNSAVFSKNLLSDPYLDTYSMNGTEWKNRYTAIAFASSYSSVNDNDGLCFVINPSGSANGISMQSKEIAVTENNTYLLRINSKCNAPATGSNYISLNAVLYFYDSESTVVGTYQVSLNRHKAGTASSMEENSLIIKVPAGATKLVISLRNSSYGTQTFYVRSVELFTIEGNITKKANNLVTLPIRSSRKFVATAKPSGQTIPYAVGDSFVYQTPTTHIGAVCTVASTGGNAGTWKNYGALEA